MLGILVAGLEGLTLESEELEGFVDGMMIIMLDAAMVGAEVVSSVSDDGFDRLVLCMLGDCVGEMLDDGARDCVVG